MSDPMDGRPLWQRQLGAVLEVVGVLLVGILLQRLTQAALGLPQWKRLQAEMLESGQPDFLLLAWASFSEQVLKYGYVLALAWAIGWWHRRRRFAAYGLHTGGHPVGALVFAGVVLFAAAGLLPNALQVASRFLPIGQGPEHWDLFPDTWSWEFLLYMVAGSFLLVPIVEELLARGYMVTRLREDFGAAGGIVLSAVFFTLAHGQYQKLEVLSLGMMVSLLLGSVLFGYVFVRTGSLVPVIVAHALVNLPTPPHPLGEPLLVSAMAALVALAWRPHLRWGRDLVAMLRRGRWRAIAWGALVLLLILVTVTSHRALLLPGGIVLLLAALVLDGRSRGSRPLEG